MHVIQCAQCGKEATAKHTRKRYCSKRCNDAAIRIKRQSEHVSVLTPRSCEKCGITYTPKTGIQKYCSSECKYQVDRQRTIERNAAKRPRAQCPVCTAFFFLKSGIHKYCSDGCRDSAGRAQKKLRREMRRLQREQQVVAIIAKDESDWIPPKLGPTFRRRECVTCGEVFKPRKPLQKTCCDLCKAELRVMNSRRAAVERKGERALVNESLDLLADRLEARKELKTSISGETNFSAEIEAYLQKGGRVKVYPVVWMPDIYNSMPEEIF